MEHETPTQQAAARRDVRGEVRNGGVGMLYSMRTLRGCVLAVGLFVIATVLCGFFLPTFSWHMLLEGLLLIAIFLVLVVWVMWHVVLARPTAWATSAAAVDSVAPRPAEASTAERPPDGGGTRADDSHGAPR